MATPPGDTNHPSQPYTGITAWIFPEWFVGPYEAPEDGKPRADGVRSRPFVPREKLIDGKYQTKEAKLAEDQNRVARARAGQQSGNQDVSIDTNG